jgi:FAD/FMN-containing dehydrogenase
MDIDRKRVEDDLRGVVVGDVFCDELSVQLYASDASIYQVLPLGVVRPKSAEDVVACVRYAAEQNLALHARGAGSGVAGESLGRGLVIDFSAHMRRWRRGNDPGEKLLDPSGLELVRVQPGVVLASLNRDLMPDGRQYGPDPATRSVTTMGGVLAVNASGSHYLRSGSPRDTAISLEVVIGSGELL